MKNLIKSSFLGLMLVLASLASNAQTNPGWFLGLDSRTLNVATTPTKGYIHASLGYEGKALGLAATYQTDSKARYKQSSMVGAELTATLFHVDAINLKAGVEGQYLLRERRAWRKFAVTPSLVANTTFYKHFEAEFGVLAFYHNEVFKDHSQKGSPVVDIWRICNPGAKFGLKYKF
jgi:hypothetical protein